MTRMLKLTVTGILILLLAGCAGLPTTGTVQPGPTYTADANTGDVTFRPNGPQTGATQEQIVEGFIRAASGPQNDWDVARLYLTSDFSSVWRPEASTIVDVLGERQMSLASDESTVSLTVTPRATVDAAGAYSQTDGDAAAPLTYSLVQQTDGEWRISRAPDGLLVDEDLFRSVFHSYTLAYFDPSWEFIVPDVRWFPTYNAETRVASALVNGEPSPWLASSVATAFPENVDLLPSVPTVNGVRQAQLSEQALQVDQTTLDRMQTQLSVSLASAQVTDVEMLVDGTVLSAERAPVLDTTVDSRALALTETGFGYLVSGETVEIPGLSETMVEANPATIAVARDRGSAAVMLQDGSAARLTSAGEQTVIDDRPGLIAPAMDPFEVIWSVPTDKPSALRATTATGEVLEITAWPEVSRVHAIQVSRDGTRIAAVVSSGNQSTLVVAGIARGDGDGIPTALGAAVTIAVLDGSWFDVTWVDSTTLGVLERAEGSSTYLEQVVGGAGSRIEAPANAAQISGVNIPSAVRVLTDDGSIFVRRSANWVQTAINVLALAVQLGSD